MQDFVHQPYGVTPGLLGPAVEDGELILAAFQGKAGQELVAPDLP